MGYPSFAEGLLLIHSLSVALRKSKTFGLTIAKCSNWPSIVIAKLGLGRGPDVIRFRDGFQLKPMSPLRKTWGEIFEPAIADLYQFRFATPDLVVDIGSNIGAFACRAAYLQPSAQVHAFEPSGKHADLLEENITLNSLRQVTVHRKAVTLDGRDVQFFQAGTGGSSGLFFKHPDGQVNEIESTTLADVDFSKSRSLFLKLDCEGAEGEIIKWICLHLQLLPKRITIACEYHHWCPSSKEQMMQELRDNQFTVTPRTLFDESYIFASRDRS